jgi:hypothetical protein
MPTPTDIVNRGLRRVGAARIANMDTDSGKEASVARDVYDEVRQKLLQKNYWTFATKRASLTRSATAPAFGWDYAYIVPADFIRVVSVHPVDDDDTTIPYKLEQQDSDDRVILCNAETCYLKYIYDLEDCNIMSPAFRDALAWGLAVEFSAALSRSSNALQLAAKGYALSLSEARTMNGADNWPERLNEGSWIAERFAELE